MAAAGVALPFQGLARVLDLPDAALQAEMYAAALRIARGKIRGGAGSPRFGKQYLDAAFNGNLFLWDTCFLAVYAKYHPRQLPVAQALDYFYELQEDDGFICREYLLDGQPMWPREHPVSINPPLLAFAELELFGASGDRTRLRRAYPHLRANFRFLCRHYRMEDGLFFGDALGSGMDNIPRHPPGWSDDGQGIGKPNLHPEIFAYEGLDPLWNRQGRAVDLSAQMALLADNLAQIAGLIGADEDVVEYRDFHAQTAAAINRLCWHEEDGFYYDLGYGRQIRRKHIGMFWTLLAGVVPKRRLAALLAHLTDPAQFWRKCPLAAYPADQPGFEPTGGYWLGGVWAPTNYMVIRGLQRQGQRALATRLAHAYYASVATVYARTGTFWENYAPDSHAPGDWARRDFCGWTGIAPIALYHEFIKSRH